MYHLLNIYRMEISSLCQCKTCELFSYEILYKWSINTYMCLMIQANLVFSKENKKISNIHYNLLFVYNKKNIEWFLAFVGIKVSWSISIVVLTRKPPINLKYKCTSTPTFNFVVIYFPFLILFISWCIDQSCWFLM